MNFTDLRSKYPVFSFNSYHHQFLENKLLISFAFSLAPDLNSTHQISLEYPKLQALSSHQLDPLLINLGLSLIPSYWKTTASPLINLPHIDLSTDQLDFWHNFFIQGMGEYYYKNTIDFTAPDFLTLKSKSIINQPLQIGDFTVNPSQVLVPIGGGKDSIVTLELLKNNFSVIPFIVNPAPPMTDTVTMSKTNPPLIVHSTFDPLLFKLNQQGFLNGHTPTTALNSALSLLGAALTQSAHIAFSNERSSNEGNVSFLDRQINHQYSKTFDFETRLRHQISLQTPQFNYFSFLRPLYELQITKIFSHFPQYFKVFSSCNRNFTLQNSSVAQANTSSQNRWCGHCPKCLSTALMLSCFIGKDKVALIMGTNPLDLSTNQPLLDQLINPQAIKPFECVLTKTEANLAVNFLNHANSTNLESFLTQIDSAHHLSPQFLSLIELSIMRK